MKYSRRAMLAALGAGFANSVLADAPLTSPRPVARRVERNGAAPVSRPTTAEMIAEANLAGTVGFVVADAVTGEILEATDGDVPQPPASVTKAVTALYAIEGLGAEFRFDTQLFADGPIIDGILDGNLILSGSGNPNLVTDELAELAVALKETGLKEVTGDFLVWGGELTNFDEIDSSQLDQVGYNPSLSGLNLNFNRVHFEWVRTGSTYRVMMDARSELYRPEVSMAQMRVVDRAVPVFTYSDGGNVDSWTVARAALGNAGSRWLPVRHPELYVGDVFRTFARGHGINLNVPKEVGQAPEGVALVTQQSVELREMMRDMLLYSTNITAEAAGLKSTQERTGQHRGLRTSALGMTRWLDGRIGITPQFVDHSGLGDASRISASEMVKLLTAQGVAEVLRPIMKNITMLDKDRNVLSGYPAIVRAKTGTLNFVSTLAGYIHTAGDRQLAFAIFAADLEAREQGKLAGDEQPRGTREWNRRAKRLQQRLLQRWGVRYA